ncbi:Intermembrane phospholipid transport system binding protein MlaC [Candidatus Entotheonellaceae bacterium PAL068K]
MRVWEKHRLAWMLLGSVILAGGMAAEAGEPQDKIRRTVNAVLNILADESLKAPARAQERRAKIRQAVLQRFGFQEMAQRSLGRHWRKRTPEERQTFVALFSDLLERSYISKIEEYSGSQRTILYPKESIDKDGYAIVRSEIVNERDLNIEIEYRLLHRDGDWQVYDVVIEGVSLVSNYRTQFNKIILEDSFATLVKRMRLKLDQVQATDS